MVVGVMEVVSFMVAMNLLGCFVVEMCLIL